MPEVFIGIDWGEYHHHVAAIDRDGRQLVDRRITHDVAGLQVLDDLLAPFDGPLPIAMERSEGLVVERLLAAGHRVYALNPRISARLRERYHAAAKKDDAFDAFALADGLRHDHHRWRWLSQPSDRLAELIALTRDRRRLLATQVKVEDQLRQILWTYHPAVTRLFSSVDRQITLEFLRDYPTPEKAGRVGERRMARFLDRNNYSGRQDPAVLVDRLREHLLDASDGTTAAKTVAALALADQLELLNGQVKQFSGLIRDRLAAHPDGELFTSFPGADVIVGATLLAEIGEDRDRYPTASMLLAEAGQVPVTKASGRTTRVHFRYAANRRLRDTFRAWAFTSIRVSPWARASYDTARGRGRPHYRALRTVGAAWGRVLWRCWQNHTPYAPDRHRALTEMTT
ncbi:MAG: IS110 family transposase [Actinomycetota bacterium]